MAASQAFELDPAVIEEIADRLSGAIVARVVEVLREQGLSPRPSEATAWLDAQEVAQRLGVARELGLRARRRARRVEDRQRASTPSPFPARRSWTPGAARASPSRSRRRTRETRRPKPTRADPDPQPMTERRVVPSVRPRRHARMTAKNRNATPRTARGPDADRRRSSSATASATASTSTACESAPTESATGSRSGPSERAGTTCGQPTGATRSPP